MIKESDFSVGLLTPEMESDYRLFTERNEQFLWYGSHNYKSFFEKYLSLRNEYIVVEQGQTIVGCLPLFFSSHFQYGTVINSLPFYGSNGAFLLDKKLTIDQKNLIASLLINKLKKLIKQENIAAVTLITSPLDNFSNNFLDRIFNADYKDFRHGQFTLLPKSKEDLLQIFCNPRPRNIRKAINSGIKIRKTNEKNDFDFLAKIHQQNMEKIGGKFKDRRFFDLVHKGFAGKTYNLYVAELNGKPISALLLFYFNHTVEYFTPCTVIDYRNLQPSSLLIYEAMKASIDKGFRYWNWGGTWSTQTGVYDFKKKWGAINKQYYYHTKLYNEDLLLLTQKEIEQAFPYFYTVPFNKLKT